VTPQTRQLSFVLKSAIHAVGLTLKEVERRLGVSGGYLTRLFAGQMPLRVDQVSEIAEAAGLDADEIFRLAFPPLQKPTTPELQLVRQAVGAPVEASSQDSSDTSPLGREVERLIERLIEKKLSERVG
jgi:transcriptional regulator with XRE-family HTH domain